MKATKRKFKCPSCGEVHGETRREFTDEQLDQEHFMLDDDSGNIKLFCNDCEVLYAGSRDPDKEVADNATHRGDQVF